MDPDKEASELLEAGIGVLKLTSVGTTVNCILQVAQAALKNAERRHALMKQAAEASLLAEPAPPAKVPRAPVKTGTPVKQQAQASKRMREKTTPTTAARQTPSTKTPDAKHLRAEDLETPKKQLFDSAWAALALRTLTSTLAIANSYLKL